jgi:hypothetical protein
MSEKKIIVKIDKAGRPTIEAQGFTGSSCQQATKPLEDAFRGAKSDTTLKDEFHQVDIATDQSMTLGI